MKLTITKEDCTKILEKYHHNSTVNSFELTAAPADQDGFFGDSYILNILYNNDGNDGEKTFFVKIFPALSSNADMAKNLLAYEKEVFYYKYLIPEYKKLRISTDFVPKCYLIKEDKIIVMENLIEQNYGSRFRFNLDETKNGLKSIAEMHAASILYEEEMRKKDTNFNFGEKYSHIFVEKFLDLNNPNSFVYTHFKEGFECIKKLLEYLPDTENCREEFLNKLEKTDFDKVFNNDLGSQKVCSHGDLWRRNILFQEKTNHCKILDFQMLRYFDPAFDVLSFLYFNFPLKNLKLHREDLLIYYYNCLSTFTKTLSNKVLPYDDFMKSVDHFELLAIYQATVGHTLDMSNNINEMFFGNRVKYCCLEFEENEKYRNAMTDDIICLLNYVLKTN